MVLDGQIRAVIFHGVWGLQVSKTLLYVTTCSLNTSRMGLLININSQPLGFLTPYLTPILLWGSEFHFPDEETNG
jgi:hypothetical protein